MRTLLCELIKVHAQRIVHAKFLRYINFTNFNILYYSNAKCNGYFTYHKTYLFTRKTVNQMLNDVLVFCWRCRLACSPKIIEINEWKRIWLARMLYHLHCLYVYTCSAVINLISMYYTEMINQHIHIALTMPKCLRHSSNIICIMHFSSSGSYKRKRNWLLDRIKNEARLCVAGNTKIVSALYVLLTCFFFSMDWWE